MPPLRRQAVNPIGNLLFSIAKSAPPAAMKVGLVAMSMTPVVVESLAEYLVDHFAQGRKWQQLGAEDRMRWRQEVIALLNEIRSKVA